MRAHLFRYLAMGVTSDGMAIATISDLPPFSLGFFLADKSLEVYRPASCMEAYRFIECTLQGLNL
jgi:hypothetical protein